MKKKLTEMEDFELEQYKLKWIRKQDAYQQGSKNWKKCQRRLMRAQKQTIKRLERACGI